jgi:hypothetical protein
LENEKQKKELEIRQHDPEIRRQHRELQIRNETKEEINQLNKEIYEMQEKEKLEDLIETSTTNVLRKGRDNINQRKKLIAKRHMRDEDDIKRANLMIERLEAEKNEILTQNEQSGSIINEATVQNQERLNAIENQ